MTLTLRVTDQNGTPLHLQALQAAAGMPEMDHEQTRVIFRRAAPGVHEAEHTFSTDGSWVARGRRASGSAFEATFTLSVGR